MTTIQRSISRLLALLGDRPRETLRTLDARRLRRRLVGFRHRWIGPGETSDLLRGLAAGIRRHGSLEGAWPPDEPSIEEGLAGFRSRTLGRLRRLDGVRTSTLFATPAGGSACKRMCMFLRWVVRPADGLDLGLWSVLRPADLVIPLDTHVARIGRRLGLSSRRTPGWAMAREITEALRRVDPVDPLRFDFPLAHFGMEGGCPPRLAAGDCEACPLRPGCRASK